MDVTKEVTKNCFIDGHGRVVFLRMMNGERRPMVCKDIYDAISQCFHILDRTLGEVVDFYRRTPAVFGEGEIRVIADIVGELQAIIASLVSQGPVPREQARQTEVDFGHITKRLGNVQNVHKKMLIAHLSNVGPVRDEKSGFRSLGAILEPTKAHLAAIHRFDELDSIIRGVQVQAKRLLDIAYGAESRFKHAYAFLGLKEAEVSLAITALELRERSADSIDVELETLRAVADIVAGEKSNRVVNALAGVPRVEPFKSRLESADVECLGRLHRYLNEFESGDKGKLYTFQRAFGRARSKLKRVVREQKSRAQRRSLVKEYENLLW